MIDYRSDTVTKPSKEMLAAMMAAQVGDDVFGEDPTINALEQKVASMFNMQAALYCPSGTMSNQIALKVHTQPGNEIICDKTSHVYQYEGGGIGFNAGCSVKLLDGNKGRFTATDVVENLNNPDDVHKPISKLVSLENTSNRGGGSCYNFDDILAIKKVCTENNLSLHLDGARLFNALVAKNETPQQYGNVFDSISICLNKGLGCPVGSVLIGKKDFIKNAKRVRKVFGGGLRQAGILAASGIYALDNNIQNLATDHQHAKLIVEVLKCKNFVADILPVETNIIIFEVKGSYTAAQFVEYMKQQHILMFTISPTRVRMVLHLDITEQMVQQTIDVIQKM